MQTHHAKRRAQQRGIPPLIDQLLDLYGHNEYDGNGKVVTYLNKNSRHAIARDLGQAIVAKLDCWMDAYKVVDSVAGFTVTIGHRYKRIFRK